LFLGLSWLYEYGNVCSTLHHYLKYWGKKKKINDNVKPFTGDESHFANARFFKEDDAPKETMP